MDAYVDNDMDAYITILAHLICLKITSHLLMGQRPT
jgi:hypothetical protein